MMMRPGNSPINDTIRKDIIRNYPDINLVDIEPSYDVSTFNHSATTGSILLSLECWDRVHPDIKTISLKEDYYLPYGIVYIRGVNEDLDEFIDILQKTL